MQYLCVEFFFEKWLSKLSYEIKVKIKEVLTCSVVFAWKFNFTKFFKRKFRENDFQKIFLDFLAHCVTGGLVQIPKVGPFAPVIHCVWTCFKAKNEITKSSGFVHKSTLTEQFYQTNHHAHFLFFLFAFFSWVTFFFNFARPNMADPKFSMRSLQNQWSENPKKKAKKKAFRQYTLGRKRASHRR